ncbi:MAG: hypothetical protein HWN67_14705, partial [Candidatus Helarchaeota archaeon]|nr:hypothetical protein [Candidatus Helarchaeota archaeon]
SIPITETKVPLSTKIYQTISRRLSWKIRFAMGIVVVIIFSILVFYPGQEKKEYDQQIYTTEEIEKAKKDVELALGYFHYYVAKTEQVIENQIITNSLIKPFTIIKKTLKPSLNGG